MFSDSLLQFLPIPTTYGGRREMTKVERIIAVLSGTITIVIVIWNTVSAIRSKPIPFWLYAVSTLAAFVGKPLPVIDSEY